MLASQPPCQNPPGTEVLLLMVDGKEVIRDAVLVRNLHGLSQPNMMCLLWFYHWPFQEPNVEVPTIYKAYIRPKAYVREWFYMPKNYPYGSSRTFLGSFETRFTS